MAPPLARGRALAAQRLWGVAFLLVLAGLVALAVAMYQKAFTSWTTVTLQADRVGNQLTKGADVKARGVLVGEVRSVRSTPQGSELELRLRPEQAARVPADTRAMIVPKTLFGEKFVALEFEGAGVAAGGGLVDGAVIAQDRSATARETSEALDSLLPLLQTLEPQAVSTTLNAVSSSLRGRGDRVGSNLVLARDYLREFNPELGTLQRDNALLAEFADTLTASTPDIATLLRELSVVNRNLVRDQTALERFLRSTTGVAGTAEGFVADNERRFVDLARESVPNLQVYERYSPQFPCMAASLVEDHRVISDSFGNLQPGLHITLEFTEDLAPFVPGDEPEYLDDPGPSCYGLIGEPIRPFPTYREAEDGYRDGQQIDTSTGRNDGPPPAGPEGPYTYPDQRRKAPQDAGSSTTSGRAALGRAVAPALGMRPDEVPDVAVVLLTPLVTR